MKSINPPDGESAVALDRLKDLGRHQTPTAVTPIETSESASINPEPAVLGEELLTSVPPEETLLVKHATDILVGLSVVLLSFLITFVLLRGDVPIHGTDVILGQKGYDAAAITAPSLSGVRLSLTSWFLSSTRFGPWIRRSLLNDNHLEVVRELSAQCRLPPLDFPIARVTEDAWQTAADDASWYVTSTTSLCAVGLDSRGLKDKSIIDFSTVMDYHRAYKSKQAQPSLVVRLLLTKAAEWDQAGFPIFAYTSEASILEQALASEKRYLDGAPLSVFDGVPVAFKDVVDLSGRAASNGKNSQRNWGDHLGTADDTMVARFKELGAIIIGTTIMTEGGMSPLGYNAHYKGPLNVFSSAHFSGGSSSGAAVAVASGLVPVSIGFDAGGSVSLPAAWSGLHGLSLTFGRVPLDKELYMSMIQAGPITNTAIDATLAYAVIAAKPTDRDHFYGKLYDGGVRGVPFVHARGIYDTENFKDVRIGVYPDWNQDASPEVQSITQATIDFFVDRGATVVPIDIPHIHWMSVAHGIKISTEYALEWDSLHSNRLSDLEPSSRLLLSTASSLSALEVISADRLRAWAFNYITGLMDREKLSVIITPTVGFAAPALKDAYKIYGVSDTSLVMKMMKHVFLANFIGLPAHSVPAGFVKSTETGDELPIGVQFIGKHWEEAVLLRMANAIDGAFRFSGAKKHKSPMQKKEHFYNPLTTAMAYAKMKATNI